MGSPNKSLIYTARHGWNLITQWTNKLPRKLALAAGAVVLISSYAVAQDTEKREVEAEKAAAAEKEASVGNKPILYIVDGTGATWGHRNVMVHVAARANIPYRYYAGPIDFAWASDANAVLSQVTGDICKKDHPTAVAIAGYSRGAIIALAAANYVRKQCGINVRFVGMLEPVNTSMFGWSSTLDPGVPYTIDVNKANNNFAGVFTTATIKNVHVVTNPNMNLNHQTSACPVTDAENGSRWNLNQIVAAFHSAGFPIINYDPLGDTNNCNSPCNCPPLPNRYAVDEPDVYPAAIGKSFYEKVLPPGTVHLGWSSYAAMWLSRVLTLIPGHFISIRSTGMVHAEFDRQGAQDWEAFLSLRATELRPGPT